MDLLVVEERQGIAADKLDSELLGQFMRGCRDDNLIIRLKLEEKTSDPPSFADLLLLICKEEARSSEKQS